MDPMVIQWFGLAYAIATLVQAAVAVGLVWVGLRVRRTDGPAGAALVAAGLVELSFVPTCVFRIEGSGRTWGSFAGEDGYLRILDLLAVLAPLEHALVVGLCAYAALRLVRR